MRPIKTNDPVIINKVKEFLSVHKKMVLGIKGVDGHPHTSLLLYVADDDFNIFFGTCRCFGKYAAIKNEPFLSMTVVEEELNPLRAVTIFGKADEIEESKLQETLEWFTSKNDAKYYVKDNEDFTMFKITPERIRWADASSGDLQLYDLEI